MPTLYLMQGPSGSGKTAFLHRWRLDDLVVSPDAMRDLVNPFDHVAGDTAHPYRDYSPETSVEAFELAETLCRARMRLGSTVIVDSCAVSRRSIDRFVRLARAYGYGVAYVRMDATVSECLAADAALDGMAKSRIAAWHDRDGVSFADIAKMVGVSKAAIANIYDGTTKRLRPKTVESVLSLPKRLVYVGPRKHDATEFVADVDRWRAAGISYRTMMFMMSGVTFGLLSNRHRRKNISQKAYDGWREGKDELDKIAKGRGCKA